jgi:hypothetical protein
MCGSILSVRGHPRHRGGCPSDIHVLFQDDCNIGNLTGKLALNAKVDVAHEIAVFVVAKIGHYWQWSEYRICFLLERFS